MRYLKPANIDEWKLDEKQLGRKQRKATRATPSESESSDGQNEKQAVSPSATIFSTFSSSYKDLMCFSKLYSAELLFVGMGSYA